MPKTNEAKKEDYFVKRRKTNRLLAGFLVLVMVLSLCEITLGQSTPVKAAVSLQNPIIDGNGVTTWDCIYFGNYWKNDTNGDGKADQDDKKEPIKWRVLSVNGNDAFFAGGSTSGRQTV